jgi:hypothetical protein
MQTTIKTLLHQINVWSLPAPRPRSRRSSSRYSSSLTMFMTQNRTGDIKTMSTGNDGTQHKNGSW